MTSPSGEWAMTSVKVPPRSIANVQPLRTRPLSICGDGAQGVSETGELEPEKIPL
jgi:hypothetical protein